MTDNATASATVSAPRQASRLETFVVPRPSPTLIKALNPVNRVLCLGGIPGLRSVPGLQRVPGVTGLSNVVRIDLPGEDLERLRAVVDRGTAAFITPNHPEFFTDWMLDKELLSRVSPLAACWATHTVVNGLGKLAQSFWLKNNLIAQIPGAAGSAGREHSIAWAGKGQGVLLHAEGGVGWHSDWIAPLFPGAIEMAAEAHTRARAAGETRMAYVAPVVWKLRFETDVTDALAQEMSYVEHRLDILRPQLDSDLGERLHAAYTALMARDETRSGLVAGRGLPFSQRQQRLAVHLIGRLAERTGQHAPTSGDASAAEEAARNAGRWLRSGAGSASANREVSDTIATLRRLYRFRTALYPAERLTLEHVAENIKRLRNDYCAGTLRDTASRFLPRPAGPRTAFMRVPEPIDVSAALGEEPALAPRQAQTLTEELRRRMQGSLDEINASLAADSSARPTFANPFRGE